jgi:ABC-type lipoprotein export system ATPase subunit
MVLALFASIDRDLGQTVMMVSHEEAYLRYFKRVVRVHDGRIAEESEEVLDTVG